MRYKTLFRVLQKVIGLFLVATSVGEFLAGAGVAAYYIEALSFGAPRGLSQLAMAVSQVVAPVAKFVLGLYLFFGAKWIANLAIPGNRPYCHECGYELTSASGLVCPECGTPFRSAPASSGEVEPPPRCV